MKTLALSLMLFAGAAQADIVPLGVGYLIGRGSAPSPAKTPGKSIETGTAKCFVQVGTLTVDAYQVTSVTHSLQKSNYPCDKNQWLNTINLANSQIVQACTLTNAQPKFFEDIQKCK